MIFLKDVIFNFKNKKMKFSFKLRKKEKVVILGQSGSGKSTILNLIAGFYVPKSGEIWLNKKNYTFVFPSYRPISILFQENNLFPHLNILDNISLGYSANLKLNKVQLDQIKYLSKKIFIDDCLFRFPSEISGGQRQRAALIRCLIRKKPILLLDEPFSALDPILYIDMINLVKEICDLEELTLLIVSHDIKNSLKISERSIVVNNGEIIYDGNLNNLALGLVPESKFFGI